MSLSLFVVSSFRWLSACSTRTLVKSYTTSKLTILVSGLIKTLSMKVLLLVTLNVMILCSGFNVGIRCFAGGVGIVDPIQLTTNLNGVSVL